jgi:hypothetical protein
MSQQFLDNNEVNYSYYQLPNCLTITSDTIVYRKIGTERELSNEIWASALPAVSLVRLCYAFRRAKIGAAVACGIAARKLEEMEDTFWWTGLLDSLC